MAEQHEKFATSRPEIWQSPTISTLPLEVAVAAPVTPKRGQPQRAPLPKAPAMSRRCSAERVAQRKSTMLEGTLEKTKTDNMKDQGYKKQRCEMMNPVSAYMSEDAYAKQLSPYVIQGEGGQYYGLGCFVNHVEGKVYPDRPP